MQSSRSCMGTTRSPLQTARRNLLPKPVTRNLHSARATCFKATNETLAESPVVNATLKVAYRCCFGQNVYLVGASDCLGNWTPAKALRMKWSQGDWWTVDIRVDSRQHSELEYKYLVMTADGKACIWKPGENYQLEIPSDMPPLTRIVVSDSWDGSFRQITEEAARSPFGDSLPLLPKPHQPLLLNTPASEVSSRDAAPAEHVVNHGEQRVRKPGGPLELKNKESATAVTQLSPEVLKAKLRQLDEGFFKVTEPPSDAPFQLLEDTLARHEKLSKQNADPGALELILADRLIATASSQALAEMLRANRLLSSVDELTELSSGPATANNVVQIGGLSGFGNHTSSHNSRPASGLSLSSFEILDMPADLPSTLSKDNTVDKDLKHDKNLKPANFASQAAAKPTSSPSASAKKGKKEQQPQAQATVGSNGGLKMVNKKASSSVNFAIGAAATAAAAASASASSSKSEQSRSTPAVHREQPKQPPSAVAAAVAAATAAAAASTIKPAATIDGAPATAIPVYKATIDGAPATAIPGHKSATTTRSTSATETSTSSLVPSSPITPPSDLRVNGPSGIWPDFTSLSRTPAVEELMDRVEVLVKLMDGVNSKLDRLESFSSTVSTMQQQLIEQAHQQVAAANTRNTRRARSVSNAAVWHPLRKLRRFVSRAVTGGRQPIARLPATTSSGSLDNQTPPLESITNQVPTSDNYTHSDDVKDNNTPTAESSSSPSSSSTMSSPDSGVGAVDQKERSAEALKSLMAVLDAERRLLEERVQAERDLCHELSGLSKSISSAKKEVVRLAR